MNHSVAKCSVFCFVIIFVASVVAEPRGTSESPPAGQQNSVAQRPIEDINVISEKIDQLVEKQLAKEGQKPNDRIGDEVFVRRIYLDIVGRIPSYEETTAFLSTRGKHKRSQLIDQLLDSKGYESHYFNFWADLLRIKTRLNRQIPGRPYIDYVKGSLAANQPYDQFVRDLISSSGPIMQRGNGAAGYYLRDFQMAEDNRANTVRLFLGSRLECAQCHDHPFDKWTQREFFEMVAFTGGMQMRMRGPFASRQREVRKYVQTENVSQELRRAIQRITRPLTYGVEGSGTGLARLPDTYQEDDGEPNEIVTAKTMFGHESLVDVKVPTTRFRPRRRRNNRQSLVIPGAREVGSRDAYADWLTSPENPRFSLVIANRLWKRAMGLALIEPVDDINDSTEATNPALMAYLTEQMVALDFDLKQYLRAIFNSTTYQREASSREPDSEEPYYFAGPILRRMTAEQMWDSLLGMAIADLDSRTGPTNFFARAMYGGEDLYDSYEKLIDKSPEEIIELAKQQVEMRSDPKKRRQKLREMMQENRSSEDGFAARLTDVRGEINELKREMNQARKQKNFPKVQNLQQQIAQLSQEMRHMPGRRRQDLARASQLQSPARVGHFLREFGQSDREQIENASDDFAVTQALSLMNGFVEKNVVANQRTVLMRNVVAAATPREKIDVVFLSMLNRYPTRSEINIWMEEGYENGLEAAHDLIWTLCNSTEFLFIK